MCARRLRYESGNMARRARDFPAMRVRHWLQRRRNRRGTVSLRLQRDEALLLDVIFTRHRDADERLEARDPAEASALIALGAAIEGAVLDEVLGERDYDAGVARARERILARERE